MVPQSNQIESRTDHGTIAQGDSDHDTSTSASRTVDVLGCHMGAWAQCTPMYFASARFISRRWFPILPEAVARLTSSLAFFFASRFATQVSHCTLGSFHSLCAGEFVDEKCCCIIKTLSYFKIAPNSPHAANRSSSYDVKTSARPIRSS